MIKLFIFDYDGLMVNSEQVVFQALKKLLQGYGKQLTWEYYCRHIGTPVPIALQHFYSDFKIKNSLAQFTHARNKIVADYVNSRLTLMNGLVPFLKLLKRKSKMMAVASSGTKKYVHSGLQKFAISPFFHSIVTIDDVTQGKPHPDLILKTLTVTGFKPHEALIIEDSPHGIEAAFRAKVFSVAIPTKGVSYDKFDKASLITKSFSHLQKIIKL